ncbi:hypothetical protein THAR02_06982 [Trichoderma harzianum]|uniref:Uncharacterized protein n=1 Tax=Trichoderma harzianum TaxID=5544 RepID=A0A0G0A6W1_TRIHA|nr:hypothetical protein THAR02_06982 [Trichoderma harzianum]
MIHHYSNNNITSSQQSFTFIFAFCTPPPYQIPFKLNILQTIFPSTMANREAGQSAYQQQLPPTYPGPVTSTTELNLAPSQSLLAKQRNLAPTITSTQDQNKMPLEGPDKEVLVERTRNMGAQTPASLAAQIEHEMQQKTST